MDARTIQQHGRESYVYLYPLVKNYLSIWQFALDAGGSQYKGPPNHINNVARVFTPDDTGVITPNSDTPYSFLILDLGTEPIVVTLPAVEAGRYYSLQIVDLYTHNVDYVGTRRDGNGGGNFLIAGPGWQGDVPAGTNRVIRLSTILAYSQFRTQLFNAADIGAVARIQSGYHAQPLSSFVGAPAPATPPAIAWPDISEVTFDSAFWQIANFLLRFCPPLPAEADLRAGLASLGLGTEAGPDPAVAAALAAGGKQGRTDIETYLSHVTTSVGLFGTPAEMAGRYLQRAAGAMGGIYGNSAEETVYPSYMLDTDGKPFDSSKHDYRMRFPPGQLPPVDAFWSVTMYDAVTRFLIRNPLDRYLINSTMLDTLVRDTDGGITLYLQRASPGAALEANWLPAPDGLMAVVMRLYLPRPEVASGAWKEPPITRA